MSTPPESLASGPAPPGSAVASPPAPPRGSTRRDLGWLMRDRSFRALFAAHVVSNLGDWLAFLALFSMAALEWRTGVLGVSFLAISFALPMLLVAPVAGVFVDRWDLRRVLVLADLLRAGLVLLMTVAPGVPALCGLLFLQQSISSFFNPAQGAALPRLVPRQHLLAANALNVQGAHLTRVLGPGLAGLLVAALGARGCFYADAASFALSAVLLATLPSLPSAHRPGRRARDVWGDLREAVHFLWGARRLRRAVAMVSLTMMSLGAFMALVAVYARDQLGAGSRSMGILVSSIGLGTIAGAGIVLHTGRRWGKTPSMLAGMLLLGPAMAGLARSDEVLPALACAVLLGAAAGAVLVPAQALVQEETPHALMGRVQSSATALISLTQVASMGIAGPAARLAGVPRLLGGAAVLLFATTVLVGADLLRRRLAPGRRDTHGLPSR